MGDTRYLNGKGRRNYLVCMVIMYAMILFYVLKIVIGVVNSVYVAGMPQEDINVEFNGYEYRYDFPFVGHMKLGHDYYPGYVQPVSGKSLVLAVSVMGSLAMDLPVLVLLLYGRRALRRIARERSPFLPETAKDIRRIGQILLLIGFLQKGIFQAGVAEIGFHTYYVDNPFFNGSWICVGFLVLLIGNVFETGCELQAEADQTL